MQDLKVTIASASDDRDVATECKYRQLRELGFVRGVTAMDQWFILVGDAWQRTNLPMNTTVRDYLTCMLERFTRRADLMQQLSVFDFVPYLLGMRKVDSLCVQDVADMSLQYVAFFPGRSSYRHEMRSLEYSASIGVTLYRQLSSEADGKDDWFSHAYIEMAKTFGQAVMVLRAMNPMFGFQPAIDEAAKKRALSFPTDADDSDIRRTWKQFDGMYLEQPSDGGSKNN